MAHDYTGQKVTPLEGVPYTFYGNVPLIFSSTNDGGAEVLNADGYSFYLIPGITYSQDWAIFSYQEPQNNNSPTPLTTITPYLLFSFDNERRMFKTTDTITREYHLALPQGKFNFGYAVDASWWPPDNIPVTDPVTDFPDTANAEDPWKIEFEQLMPINNINQGSSVFKVTIHHRGIDKIWGVKLFAWDLSTNGGPPFNAPQTGFQTSEYPDEYTSIAWGGFVKTWWDLYGADGKIIPGHHFGLIVVLASPGLHWETAELEYIFAAKFVDIYVEE